MKPPTINYDGFELPFFKDGEELSGEDEISFSKSEQLEQMQNQIPEDVRFLGEIGSEIDHSPGLTWETEDYYYLMPWKGTGHQWALFRISWDDNWGRYEWTSDARISDVEDPNEAARLMFKGLMDKWGYDLTDEERAPYKKFLDDIGA
jgi:hypothetical protein